MHYFRKSVSLFLSLLMAGLLIAVVPSAQSAAAEAWSGGGQITHFGGLVQNPTVSPDGQWVYYQRYNNGAEGSSVFRMRPDGSEPQLLSDWETYGYCYGANLSGDGSKIVFVSAKETLPKTYIADADGSNAKLVGNAEDYIYMGMPNFDGSEVAYANNSEGYKAYNMIVETGESIPLAPDMTNCIGMQFTPDGQKIIFYQKYNGSETYANIFAVNRDGTGLVNLLAGTSYENKVVATWYKSELDVHGSTDYAAISPDSVKVVCSAFDENGVVQLIEIMLDGSGVRQLTEAETNLARPKYSPSGDKLAYVQLAGPYHWQLFLMNADGTNSRQLTFLPDATVNFFGFHPFGDRIYYNNLVYGQQIFDFEQYYGMESEIGYVDIEPEGAVWLDDFAGEVGDFDFSQKYTEALYSTSAWKIAKDSFVAGNVLAQTSGTGSYNMLLGPEQADIPLTDYEVSAWVCPQTDLEMAGLVCRFQQRDPALMSIARLVDNRVEFCRWASGGAYQTWYADYPFELGSWHHLRVAVYGALVNVYVNGENVLSFVDPLVVQGDASTPSAGRFGIVSGPNAQFAKLAVSSKQNMVVNETWKIDLPEELANPAFSSSDDGILSVGNDGVVRAVSAGTASVTVTGDGFSNTFSITVANLPPSARDETVTTEQDVSIVNRRLPCYGEGVTCTLEQQAAHGTAVVSGETFSYTPEPGYYGEDSFTYRVSNESGSATGTITIFIRAGALLISDAEDELNPMEGWSPNPGTEFSVSSEEAYSGHSSFKYTVSANQMDAPAYVGFKSLPKDSLYLAKMQVKLANGTSPASVGNCPWYANNSDNTNYISAYQTYTLYNDRWTEMTAAFHGETVDLLQMIPWDLPEGTSYFMDELKVYPLLVQSAEIAGERAVMPAEADGVQTAQYTVRVIDSIFGEKTALKGTLSWSILDGAPEGVSLSVDGLLTVDSSAKPGVITLCAELPAGIAGNEESIIMQKEVVVGLRPVALFDAEEEGFEPWSAGGMQLSKSTDAHSGQYSMLVSGGNGAAVNFDTELLVPGRKYVGRIYVKLPDDFPQESSADFCMYLFNAPLNFASSPTEERTIYRDRWTPIYFSFLYGRTKDAAGMHPTSLTPYTWNMDPEDAQYLVDDLEIYEEAIFRADLEGSGVISAGESAVFCYQASDIFGTSFGSGGLNTDVEKVEWSLTGAPEGVSLAQTVTDVGAENTLSIGPEVPEGTVFTLRAQMQKKYHTFTYWENQDAQSGELTEVSTNPTVPNTEQFVLEQTVVVTNGTEVAASLSSLTGQEGENLLETGLTNGTVTADVRLVNASENAADICVVLALYDGDQLLSLSISNPGEGVAPKDVQQIQTSLHVVLPDNPANCRLTVMAWDSLENMQPYMEAVIADMQAAGS